MIYLDNSATTPLSERVRAELSEAMDAYGNPSSVHAEGLRAAALLGKARDRVLSSLGLRRTDGYKVIFTASGSEADNLAILCTARAKTHRVSDRIIISDSEHSAVSKTADAAAAELGMEVVRIPTVGGRLDMERYESELSKGAFLVSIMRVNNESGAVYDVERAFRMAKAARPETLTHCDAVQGFLRVECDPRRLCADMISISGHKIHAPKGVGALVVSPEVIKRRALSPVIYGGGQEDGLRSGTENMLGIVGLGAAAEEGALAFAENAAYMQGLYAYARERLSELDVKLNIPEVPAGHIINLTLPGIRSETMLHLLSSDGICVSAGSACSAHGGKKNGAMLAFGLTQKEADSTIRVSMSHYNTKNDIDALVDSLGRGLARLVRRR